MAVKKSASKAPKVFGYKVDIYQYCFDSEYSNEAYGDWSEDWSNEFRTIRQTKTKDEYPDVVALESFAPGEPVYVVWAEWTQADSFGQAHNRGYDVLGVFRTWGQAAGLEKLARETPGFEPVEYLGLKYYFGDFKGYFDYLEDIHIESTQISD
jgi:hypothetical protein